MCVLIFLSNDRRSPKQIVAMSIWWTPLHKNIASYCFLKLIEIHPHLNLGVHQIVLCIAQNICLDSYITNLLSVFPQRLKRTHRHPAQATCGFQLWIISMTQVFLPFSSKTSSLGNFEAQFSILSRFQGKRFSWFRYVLRHFEPANKPEPYNKLVRWSETPSSATP